MKWKAFVISHTHWDREWYLTVEQYRLRLARCLDRAIGNLDGDPAWHSFYLDGQTQAVLDYLEARPEREADIRRLVAAGRLRVGPWRVASDEYMVCGEGLVRNLLAGRRDGAALGGWDPVGYLADNFCHNSQMPQILREFGLDNAVFWRGYDENRVPASEVRWRGADGSEVLAILLVRSYANASGFGPGPDADRRLERNLEAIQRASRTGLLPIGDGTDHALPAADLAGVLAEMRRTFPDVEFVHSTWTEFLAAVRAAAPNPPRLDGELIYSPGLHGTCSCRVNQKQANADCERRLLHCAEPLAVLAWLAGDAYPRGFLRRAWDLMIKNAAHDSIGGAHLNAVARDVEQRLARVREIADGVAGEALDALAGTGSFAHEATAPARLALYNPNPRPFSGVVELAVDLPDPHGRDWLFNFYFKGLALYDGTRRLPVDILSDEPALRPLYRDRSNPAIRNVRTIRLLTCVEDVPPFGFKTLRVTPGGEKPKASILVAEDAAEAAGSAEPAATPPLVVGDGVLRNRCLEVRVHPDGRLDVSDLTSGHTWQGWNALRDEADNGSQYAFAAGRSHAVGVAGPGTLRTALNTPLRGTVRVDTRLPSFDDRPVARDLTERRLGNDPARVDCPLTVEISLGLDSRRVEVAVTLDNRGAGHRLRAAFPFGSARARLRAAMPFDFVDRQPPERLAGRERGVTAEQLDKLNASGAQGLVALDEGGTGLLVATRGLYEYAWERAGGTLYLTLFRSVGTVMYGFEAWGPADSGYLPAVHRMEYALVPFAGDLFESTALDETDAFLRPLLARQYPEGEDLKAGRSAGLPDRRLWFSAWKKAEDRESAILRFYSVADEPIAATLPVPANTAEAWLCRLDETRERRLTATGGTVQVDVGPRKIVTLELVPGRG